MFSLNIKDSRLRRNAKYVVFILPGLYFISQYLTRIPVTMNKASGGLPEVKGMGRGSCHKHARVIHGLVIMIDRNEFPLSTCEVCQLHVAVLKEFMLKSHADIQIEFKHCES